MAVDAAGTAHVAWLAQAGDAGSLEYCQVLGPRGGWLVWDAGPGNAGMHPIRIAALPAWPRR